MRPINKSESKTILLCILKDFDFFCREHDLRYSLAGGTLIGALRHKGFIPWDDDIDVFMLREDYNRFIKEYYSNNYCLVTSGRFPHWFYGYSRIADMSTRVYWGNWTPNHGLWLAILPIDNYPGNKTWQKTLKELRLYQAILKLKISPWLKEVSFIRNIIKTIGKFFFKPIPEQILGQRINSTIQRYNNVETDLLGNNSTYMLCKDYIPHHFDRHCFDEFIEVDFEGIKAMAMAGYDKYLTGVFGNWRQLPPEDQRVSHGYTVHYIENEYTDSI